MKIIRHLPEFVAYARSRECDIGDNELITDRTEWPLPTEIQLPAWRVDVHTVIRDPIANHLSLWQRFIISASGDIYVWQRPPADRFITLAEWRKLRKT